MLGLGGLIGGGIFSVLGVITTITGPFSYFSYLLMGLISLLTGYSYLKLNLKWGKTSGGEFSIVQKALEGSPKQKFGEYVGVILYFGYVGTMSLYAYTFATYFLSIFNLPYNFLHIALVF